MIKETVTRKDLDYETDAMYGMLKEAGVMMVDPKEAADIYIVNTCSVTNMAERKSRQMLHRAKKKNPDVVVVAVGCYAQVGKEELSKDTNIDLIIGNNKKKDLIHILEEHMGEKESSTGLFPRIKRSLRIIISHGSFGYLFLSLKVVLK